MTRPATHPPPPPNDVDEALQRVRDHGGRVTHAKRALAELLFESGDSLTTDQIIAALGGLDRSAIYRNLAQFEELGIAEHIHIGHGQAVYRASGSPTIPVVCAVCGTRYDLDRAQTQEFASRVAKSSGVTLDLTHFPLTGTCRDCSA